MIRVGRKFLKPHFCPDCHRFIVLVKHPQSKRCVTCRNRRRRKSSSENSTKRSRRKYNNDTYRRAAQKALSTQGYCALCGCTHNLTCHHTVNIRSGEWQGKHLTVLCERCHLLWEQKVNIVRSAARSKRKQENRR